MRSCFATERRSCRTFSHFRIARKYGVSADAVRKVVKRVGNTRKKSLWRLRKNVRPTGYKRTNDEIRDNVTRMQREWGSTAGYIGFQQARLAPRAALPDALDPRYGGHNSHASHDNRSQWLALKRVSHQRRIAKRDRKRSRPTRQSAQTNWRLLVRRRRSPQVWQIMITITASALA
jgi:hypothetical protein